MGNYLVLSPIGFVNSKGEAVTVHRPGVVVEMDDEQAKELLDAGKLKSVPVKESKSTAKPKAGS